MQVFESLFSHHSSQDLVITLAAGMLGLGGIIILLVAGWSYATETEHMEIIVEEVVPAAVATASAVIYVDINGAINHPGLYQLPSNARVADVVSAAGGFRDSADAEYIARSLNLSAKLSDAQKIYIPSLGEGKSVEVTGSGLLTNDAQATSGLISVNSATSDQLQDLDGVGEARATAIIRGRPYSSLDELVYKKAIPQSVLDSNRSRMSL